MLFRKMKHLPIYGGRDEHPLARIVSQPLLQSLGQGYLLFWLGSAHPIVKCVWLEKGSLLKKPLCRRIGAQFLQSVVEPALDRAQGNLQSRSHLIQAQSLDEAEEQHFALFFR